MSKGDSKALDNSTVKLHRTPGEIQLSINRKDDNIHLAAYSSAGVASSLPRD